MLNEIMAQMHFSEVEKLEKACQARKEVLQGAPTSTAGEPDASSARTVASKGAENKCTRRLHVCGPSVSSEEGGCENCGRKCHANNRDELCPYYGRDAGQLTWRASAEDLADAMPGTGGALPHRTQVGWSLLGKDDHGELIVRVSQRDYLVGQASGAGCNCLIHSLSQCLGIVTNMAAVREDLIKEFGSSPGRMKVGAGTFLELEHHWVAVLRGIFKHALGCAIAAVDVDQFCIKGLYLDKPGNGLVVGLLSAPRSLVVACRSFVHFEPCLLYHGERSGTSVSKL